MNRKLMLGIAMFFAVLGCALVGGENSAVAFHHGCGGGGKMLGGLFARKHCRGAAAAECAPVAECAPAPAPAPCPPPSCGGRGKHGGLLARLRARRASRCSGAMDNCAPAAACCEPAPTTACCSAPVADCGCAAGEVIYEGEVIEGAPVEAVPTDAVPAAPAAAEGESA